MNEPGKSRVGAEDREDVHEHMRLKAPVVYEVVRQGGVEELARPLRSLAWSGFAAGLAISTSVYAEAFLHAHLPDTQWRALVENFGYCTGFLIVILGRMQLFTENTITVVLPLLADWSRRTLLSVGRLWTVVLVANMAGTLVSALLVMYVGIIGDQYLAASLEVSRHFADKSPLEILQLGIPAGFLVAALVWVMPSAKGSEFWLVMTLTYVIAIGDLAHVIAGSTEIFLLVLAGELPALGAVWQFLLPAFAGNVIGGTGLFALIAYAQVRQELE
ncbi:MAG TPA: formate/nitrite transporter family protein [Steroidobacteraceae bacterium]|nr:formate/nitrite transporter family protein [Steroidobacteraceae bacterium]